MQRCEAEALFAELRRSFAGSSFLAGVAVAEQMLTLLAEAEAKARAGWAVLVVIDHTINDSLEKSAEKLQAAVERSP